MKNILKTKTIEILMKTNFNSRFSSSIFHNYICNLFKNKVDEIIYYTVTFAWKTKDCQLSNSVSIPETWLKTNSQLYAQQVQTHGREEKIHHMTDYTRSPLTTVPFLRLSNKTI